MIFLEANNQMKKVKFFSSYCSDDQIYQNIISSWGKGNATYKDIKITKDSDYEYAVILNRAVPDRYLPKENILGFSHEPRETVGLDLNNLNFISNNVSNYYISNNSGFIEPFKEGFCYVCPADFGKSEGVDYFHNKKMSMILSLSRFMPGHHMRHNLLERILKSDMDIHFYANGLNKIYSDERVKEFDWNIFHVPYEDYQTQIVIENIIDNSWATEKLTNCIIKKTLPIYYGSKNIADEFYGQESIKMLGENADENFEIIKEVYEDNQVYEKNMDSILLANSKLYNEKNLMEFLNSYFK